jgi:phosphatidylserine/phosphatidylglycerophosphate/cardiolipin synthase-like enzyme
MLCLEEGQVPGHGSMAPTPEKAQQLRAGSVAGTQLRRNLWDAPVEILTGADTVNRTVARLFTEARREVLLFMGQPMLADRRVEAAFRDLQARGVEVRQILPRDFLSADDPGSRRYVDAQRRSLASTARLADSLPGKLIIVDRRVGLVSLNRQTGSKHQASILRHRDLVSHLVSSFVMHWEQAQHVEA